MVETLATDPRVRQAGLEFERPFRKAPAIGDGLRGAPRSTTEKSAGGVAKAPVNQGIKLLKPNLDILKPGFAFDVAVRNFGRVPSTDATLQALLFQVVPDFSSPDPNDRILERIRTIQRAIPTLEVNDSYAVPFEFGTGNQSPGGTYQVALRLLDGFPPADEAEMLASFETGYTLASSGKVQHVCLESGRGSNGGASDPLMPKQWNLRNTGQPLYPLDRPGVSGEDIGMENVLMLGGGDGDGVRVAVVDSGMEICHPDLRENVEPGRSYNFNARLLAAAGLLGVHTSEGHAMELADPFNFSPLGDHGTSVAGIIAADADNGIGIRGVAPGALLRGYNMMRTRAADQKMAELDSLGGSFFAPESTDVDVFNMSYGDEMAENIDRDMERLFSFGTAWLRGGLGAIYVKAAGNEYDTCPDFRVAGNINNEVGCWSSNSDPRQNLPYLINVGAFNAGGKKSSHSSAGPNLWISAPGGEDEAEKAAVLSVDQMGWDRGYNHAGSKLDDPLDSERSSNPDGDYTALMNGSSAAAPHVSGAVAMLLEAFPGFTWRDVKHVLAKSARKIDPDVKLVSRIIGGTELNLRFPWTENAAGFRYHDWYGFGALDLDRAMEIARQHAPDSLGEFHQSRWFDARITSVPIPDNDGGGWEVPIAVDGLPEDANIEAVVLEVAATHEHSLHELGVYLQSPSDTPSVVNQVANSVLTRREELPGPGWRILSNAFYGENPNGVWRINVVDAFEGHSGELDALRLRFYYGTHSDSRTVRTPTAPTAAPGDVAVEVVEEGLSVTWAAPNPTDPSVAGGAPILRYVATAVPQDGRTNLTCTADPSAAGCTIEGALPDMAYEVTVRAENAVGAGPPTVPVTWSPASEEPDFSGQHVISTDANDAYSVRASDLDGDGDPDVLSASRLDGKIAWYENLGGGSFSAQRVISTAARGAYSVHASDLDGDGDPDVLSASFGDGKIAWYENLGGGSFSAQRLISAAARGAYSVHASDLDGDGDPDVLSASAIDNKIAWYENFGGGAFSAQRVISTAAGYASSVHASDLDGDGDPDVLSASAGDDEIAWYENVGGGAFSAQRVISTAADFAVSVHASDLDGDGDPDVLSASAFDDKIAWYENLGGGSFAAQRVISADADSAWSVHASDLDGDGDPDVLSASAGDDKIAWYENLGGRAFSEQRVISTDADGAWSVHASDLDGDGHADVLSASRFDDKIAWYENLRVQNTEDAAWLDELLNRRVDSGSSPGIIAAVVDHRGIREVAAAGVRKAGDLQELSNTDIIHIGSNTKAMTSAMLATLVRNGAFSNGWDTTIANVFPELLDEIHTGYHTVDLWQLVTMTAGIKRNASNWRAYQGLDIIQQRYRILRENLAEPPAAAAGQYLYSNLGYAVAGAMAEKVTGKSWETLMQEQLFEPLGMSETGFGPPGTPGELDQPWGHRRDPQSGDWVPNQFDNARALGPAGTVHLSLEDWSKFMALWLPDVPPAILDRATLDRLITPTSGNYAAGWFVASRSWAQGKAINHSGSNTSWYTILWIAPQIGRAYVVGANSAEPDVNDTFRMLDVIVGEMVRHSVAGVRKPVLQRP